MPTTGSLAWTSLEKSGRWRCSRLRSVALYYDWSWWYPSGNRPLQQYLSFTAGRWLWSVRTPGWQPDCKIQSGRNGQRDWCMSRVTAIISALVICIIVCLSWAVNHYRDNAIAYKASATKMPENWSWRTRQLLTCRCVSVMLLRSMQNTQELADAKAWKWCSAWWCYRWSSQLHQSGLARSVRERTASGVDNAASPDWQTPLNRIISPSRERLMLCKNNWKDRSILMSSADRVAHIDGQLMQQWAIHALPAEYKCLK